jgi:hypothetical protein
MVVIESQASADYAASSNIYGVNHFTSQVSIELTPQTETVPSNSTSTHKHSSIKVPVIYSAL